MRPGFCHLPALRRKEACTYMEMRMHAEPIFYPPGKIEVVFEAHVGILHRCNDLQFFCGDFYFVTITDF